MSVNLLLEEFLDIALNSANKSASSAEPPRSPLKVLVNWDLMPMTSSFGSELKLPAVAFILSAKGAATVMFVSSAAKVFFPAPFCFQGGKGRDSSFLLGFFFCHGFSKGNFGFVGASLALTVTFSSPSSLNLLLEFFIDIARNSASKSASSAAPPLLPLKVLGKLDLMPIFSSFGSRLGGADTTTSISFFTFCSGAFSFNGTPVQLSSNSLVNSDLGASVSTKRALDLLEIA